MRLITLYAPISGIHAGNYRFQRALQDTQNAAHEGDYRARHPKVSHFNVDNMR